MYSIYKVISISKIQKTPLQTHIIVNKIPYTFFITQDQIGCVYNGLCKILKKDVYIAFGQDGIGIFQDEIRVGIYASV